MNVTCFREDVVYRLLFGSVTFKEVFQSEI